MSRPYVAQLVECHPCTERLLVLFPVKTHARVAGLIPSWGAYRRRHSIDVSFPHSPVLSLQNQ